MSPHERLQVPPAFLAGDDLLVRQMFVVRITCMTLVAALVVVPPQACEQRAVLWDEAAPVGEGGVVWSPLPLAALHCMGTGQPPTRGTGGPPGCQSAGHRCHTRRHAASGNAVAMDLAAEPL